MRVPALLISPWVGKQAFGSQDHGLGQDKVIFDHTSILRTILQRFASDANGNIPNMTKRVSAANDLGALLTEQAPRPDCTPTPMIPGVPIDLSDNFRMAPTRTELQVSLDAVADHARVAGQVPSEEL